ncbi:hypothetical protein V500_11198, partial [Pseudogymnoascus sp. VKM F-4518 (FW-2643)]
MNQGRKIKHTTARGGSLDTIGGPTAANRGEARARYHRLGRESMEELREMVRRAADDAIGILLAGVAHELQLSEVRVRDGMREVVKEGMDEIKKEGAGETGSGFVAMQRPELGTRG